MMTPMEMPRTLPRATPRGKNVVNLEQPLQPSSSAVAGMPRNATPVAAPKFGLDLSASCSSTSRVPKRRSELEEEAGESLLPRRKKKMTDAHIAAKLRGLHLDGDYFRGQQLGAAMTLQEIEDGIELSDSDDDYDEDDGHNAGCPKVFMSTELKRNLKVANAYDDHIIRHLSKPKKCMELVLWKTPAERLALPAAAEGLASSATAVPAKNGLHDMDAAETVSSPSTASFPPSQQQAHQTVISQAFNNNVFSHRDAYSTLPPQPSTNSITQPNNDVDDMEI